MIIFWACPPATAHTCTHTQVCICTQHRKNKKDIYICWFTSYVRLWRTFRFNKRWFLDNYQSHMNVTLVYVQQNSASTYKLFKIKQTEFHTYQKCAYRKDSCPLSWLAIQCVYRAQTQILQPYQTLCWDYF